jgi:hypothetical protein
MTAVMATPTTGRESGPVPASRARIDAAVRSVAVVALWSALLLVAYWWSAGGGIRDLAGWATGLAWSLLCWLAARYLQRRGAIEQEEDAPAAAATRPSSPKSATTPESDTL